MRSNTTIRGNRRHTLRVAAAVLTMAASLSLTACNGDDTTGQGDPSAASSASSSGGGSGKDDAGSGGSGGSEQGGGKDSAGKDSGGQGTAAGSGSGQNASVGKCRTDDLDISASDTTIDGDNEGSVAVTFLNSGGKGCVLSGFAGIDLKTSEGNLSAERTGQPADRMVLADGKSVSFNISYPMNDSGGSGVSITGLVVTPPGETKPYSLEWPGAATLPVTDGSGSPVKVGPIGSAGQGGAQ
ncbi:DUF4232 domain-containing protein [Streptomyces sp. NBC_01283]|uniref:DUF4232 domain-containing protein n=1 Tax=Streptomyces sp. NBC_01283 TaxID=2903812 RepID=UPI00352F9453|nr:DUF4232 domain-containing protein [Streptomyces sp. NBC_01283]